MKRTQIQVPEAAVLPSGRWRCRVTIGKKKPSFTADTKEEAEELARQAVAEFRAGVLKEKENAETVESCMKRYINDRRGVLSPSTIRGYGVVLDNRFPQMMKLDIHSVTRQQWQAAVNAEARTVSPKTLRNAWGLMSAVIKENTGAAPVVRLPAIAKNTRPFLDDQQTKKFIKAIKGTKYEAPFLLGLHSLRQSEILAIRWKNIDIKNGTITVKGARVMDEDNRLVYRSQNKTSASQRVIPIIIPRLKELAEDQDPEAYVAQATGSWLLRALNKICEENGLPKIGLHGLRHTFASLCYFQGIPEKAVMDMGGWNNPTVLREIYTHLSARQKTMYTERLQAFFQE